MTVTAPTRTLPYPDQKIDCEQAMEAEFHAIHDMLVWGGLSERAAAIELLETTDHPFVAVLASDAEVMGWPGDIVRRALLSLAGHNLARVTEDL